MWWKKHGGVAISEYEELQSFIHIKYYKLILLVVDYST